MKMEAPTSSLNAFLNAVVRLISRHVLVCTSLVVFALWIYVSPESFLQSTPHEDYAEPVPQIEIQEEPAQSSSRPQRHWPGWEGISHIVAFGDSYSATQFNWNGVQPSIENPLGNPDKTIDCSMNRPNWIDYITTAYNDTFVKTVNLASGGATLDNDIVLQFLPSVKCMRDQVRELYLPLYASHPSHFDWHPENTLFVWWIGINDVGNMFRWENGSDVLRLDLAQYSVLVDEVYGTGARNFLFLTVPPVDRAPINKKETPEAVATQAEYIVNWNVGVEELALNLSTIYEDVTATVYNTHALYTEVLDERCSYDETCPYKDTTGSCLYYSMYPPETWDSWDTEHCEFPVEDYFWRDVLHPTYRVNSLTAKEVAAHLNRIPSNNWEQ